MTILALANLDGKRVSSAALQTVAHAVGVTAVVFAGDVLPPRETRPGVAARGGDDAELYASFFDALAALDVPIAIVPGERDWPADHLRRFVAQRQGCARRLAVVDRGVAALAPGLTVGGLGGLLSEDAQDSAGDEAQHAASTALAPLRGQSIGMLLVHTPPLGRIVDREEGRPIGRRAVNDVIETLGVRLVVCGHAREGQGQEMIGPALVVNPGALAEGRYAIIDPRRRIARFGVLPRCHVTPPLRRDKRRAPSPFSAALV